MARHGHQIIQDLEKRTQGRWRPSAGSIYPTLQLLEDEGLLTSDDVDGRRTYSLTDAGGKAAAEHPLGAEGWLETDDGKGPSLPELAGRLIAAAAELEKVGTDAARQSARETLIDALKRLFATCLRRRSASRRPPEEPWRDAYAAVTTGRRSSTPT